MLGGGGGAPGPGGSEEPRSRRRRGAAAHALRRQPLGGLRAGLDLLGRHDELAGAEVVDGAELGRDLGERAVAAVDKGAVVGPGGDHLGQDEIVQLLGALLADQPALEPGRAVADERGGDAGGGECGDAEALEFVVVCEVLAGAAPDGERDVCELERGEAKGKFAGCLDQLARIGCFVHNNGDLGRVEIDRHIPCSCHDVSFSFMRTAHKNCCAGI